MKIYCRVFQKDPNHPEEGKYVRVMVYRETQTSGDGDTIAIGEHEPNFDFFARIAAWQEANRWI